MKIVENYVNASEDYGISGDIVQDLKDTYMGEDATVGDIFRASQKEHGRCVSKIYVELVRNGRKMQPYQVGWYFEKRVPYQDSKDTYLQGVWVTLYDEHYEKPIRKYHVIN